MSRIGRQVIKIPAGVEVNVVENKITCKGPKGSLDLEFDNKFKLDIQEKEISVLISQESQSQELSALRGTTRALINNIINGVKDGFEKKLEINGVGYNAQVSGKKLTLNLGFSHPIDVDIPEGLEVKVEKNIVIVSGIDKQKVGQFAARTREYRKPEPYKGKGIRYVGEYVRKKAGKKAVGTEGGAE